jgi:hypothetical protein
MMRRLCRVERLSLNHLPQFFSMCAITIRIPATLNRRAVSGAGSTSHSHAFPHRNSIITAKLKKSWRWRESQYAVCRQ